MDPQRPSPTLRTRSLLGKALAMLLGAVAAVAALSLLVFVPRAASTFEEELAKRGESLGKVLAQHQELRLALALHDGPAATRVAEQVLGGDADARYALLVGGDGRVLGSASSPALPPAELARLAQAAPGRDGDVYRFAQEVSRDQAPAAAGGGEGLDFATGDPAPAPSKALGRIVIGLSPSAALRRLLAHTLTIIGLTAVTLVLAFLIFFNRVSVRLRRMVRFAEQVTQGELGAALPADGDDEVGQLARTLGEMTERMSSMVGQLQETSAALARASGEILSSSTQQGQYASLQASSVSEARGSVNRLRQTFAQTAEQAQKVIDLAKRSEESTSSGRAAVQESVAAVGQLREQVLAISRTIVGLVERTNQIRSIIDAVNELAEESNVLALNAAIEATKAGEQGRGFAVVAREVRSLAERSKVSTAQVRVILQDIGKATREVMGAIDGGTRQAQAGMELADRAGQSIAKLNEAIGESSSAAKQIATSLRAQTGGVDQIWEAMREIDRGVGESVAQTSQLEGASRSLKDTSDRIIELVGRYRV